MNSYDNKPPVILQVIPELVTGGAERSCVDVAHAIVEAGGTSIVCSAGGPMVYELEHGGSIHYQHSFHSKNPLKIWANARLLKKLIKKHGVDIIHARSRAPAWSAKMAADATGIKFVTTFHNPYSFTNKFKKLYNSVMAKADHMIANSNYVKDYAMTNYNVPEDKITRIYRGIDLDFYNPQNITPYRLVNITKSWNLSEDSKVILVPGRLSRRKGQEMIIKAAALLKDRNFKCVLIGSDQGRTHFKQELIDLTGKLNLGSNVFFADHCDDMPAAYTLADVVVVPSQTPEGLGRVSIEAQAMGKPVIVSDKGALPETIIPNKTGYVIPSTQIDRWADKIEEVLKESGSKQKIDQSERLNFIKTTFSRENMCAQTLEVYEKVLSGR